MEILCLEASKVRSSNSLIKTLLFFRLIEGFFKLLNDDISLDKDKKYYLFYSHYNQAKKYSF